MSRTTSGIIGDYRAFEEAACGVIAMFAHIVGDGVELRLLETRHAEEVFRAVEENREHLSRWLPWVDHTKSPEDVKDFIQHELLRFAKNSGFAAGIFHHGKYVGNIGVHDIDWNAGST